MTNMEIESGQPFTFDDIGWTGEPGLRDGEKWEHNLGIVRLLLEHGTPTTIQDTPWAQRIPQLYDVDGVAVEFLPNWGFYKVGNLNLNVPESAQMLQDDLAAAKYVASRQVR